MKKKAGLKRIMRNYQDCIYSYSFYILGNREDAEDITQEVLIKAWQNLDSLSKRSIKTWIMKVTRNLCIDHLRHRRVEQTTKPDPLPPGNPEAIVEGREVQVRVREAISKLPLALRSTVILREIQGLKYKEISEILGIPLNSVKVRLWRGRRLLRQILSPVRKR